MTGREREKVSPEGDPKASFLGGLPADENNENVLIDEKSKKKFKTRKCL